LLPHVADPLRQFVGSDAVEPAVRIARAEVLLDGTAVAGLRRCAQVEHRPG